ncbi:MAG: 30S ribosome-binding factor RbfA [Bacillota bacterium]|jgi:ribosome-binding factor A
MSYNKVGRLAGEIQKEVADILAHQVKDPRIGFVSVRSVEAAPDGSSARIYISSLDNDRAADIMAALQSAKGFIRKSLAKRLKARVVPELYFVMDNSIEYAIKMADIIDRQIKADQMSHNEDKIPE